MSNCHTCKFKKNNAGNAHVKCGFPVFSGTPEKEEVALILSLSIILTGGNKNVSEFMGFTFSPHGVQNGWCHFPIDYDPVWLVGDCNFHTDNLNKEQLEHLISSFNK